MPRFRSISASSCFLQASLVAGALWLVGCSSSSAAPSAEPKGPLGSVARKYADYFPLGAAINNWELDQAPDALADFNHLTCENAMKPFNIHPSEDRYDFAEADRIANFARSHGFKMTGHALLWHRQTADWWFDGLTASDPSTIELLKSRLKAHIETVVTRYADVVDNWDVVNEVISSYDHVYRDGSEGSKWYEMFGNEEYVYWAYQYAHDALEAVAKGSSVGKLYYNDYTVTSKVDKILTMLSWLETRGIRVDGVGFQSHEYMNWPGTDELQGAFDRFVAAGYKLKISELDVTVYDDYATGGFVPSPQVEYTPELADAQAQRFASLFSVYRANKDNITSVTFWGLTDNRSWLNYVPVEGRADYPLLYLDPKTPKSARAEIMNF